MLSELGGSQVEVQLLTELGGRQGEVQRYSLRFSGARLRPGGAQCAQQCPLRAEVGEELGEELARWK